MRIGCGISGTIYAGNVRKNKNGLEVWTKKENVTEEAIAAVFQWFISQNGKDGKGYEITFEGHGTLTYRPWNKNKSKKLIFENVSSNIICSRIGGGKQLLDLTLPITPENEKQCIEAYIQTGKLKVTVEVME